MKNLICIFIFFVFAYQGQTQTICVFGHDTLGFRIQVYQGKSRKEAEEIRRRVYYFNEKLRPYLIHENGTYSVRVGDFLRKEDASFYKEQLDKIFEKTTIIKSLVNKGIDKNLLKE